MTRRTHNGSRPRARFAASVRVATESDTSLDALTARLIPKITPEDVRALTNIIQDAQHQPPENKELFVKQVNRLLDLMHRRIQMNDGELARLAANPGTKGRGYIQFGTRHGSRGGFKSATIKLIDVPTNYFPTGQRFAPEK